MKSPRGFGKNYFTFSAVLAYSVAQELQSQVSHAYSRLHKSIFEDEELLDECESPPDLVELPLIITTKACHCSCLCSNITRLKLLLNHYIPRCPYYTTYFAFRRSGVHPPSK